MRLTLATVALLAAAPSAKAALPVEKRLHWQQHRLNHHQGSIRWFMNRGVMPPPGRPADTEKPRYRVWWSEQAVRWTKREIGETREMIARLRQRWEEQEEQEEQVELEDDWGEWSCIHEHEGAADSNTGNGYYGGLQMDWEFMQTYGSEFVRQWGTADRWPVWAQVEAARRARDSGRGYTPWPNTARICGQL